MLAKKSQTDTDIGRGFEVYGDASKPSFGNLFARRWNWDPRIVCLWCFGIFLFFVCLVSGKQRDPNKAEKKGRYFWGSLEPLQSFDAGADLLIGFR